MKVKEKSKEWEVNLESLLRVKDLCKYFYRPRHLLKQKKYTIKAVHNVSLNVYKGEILAFVGETGSGKTTLAKTAIKIYEPTSGRIWFNDKDITDLSGRALKKFRKNVLMAFQDPDSSLNPRRTIKSIIALPLKVHTNLTKLEREKKVLELLDLVELPREVRVAYPRSLSGGQKQRVGLARALSTNPQLVVLDEPTSALDVSVQSKFLSLLEKIQKAFNLTTLCVSHDLIVVKNISHRVAVMYAGEVVEFAATDQLFLNPYHPYTCALLSAVPVVFEEENKFKPKEITLKGEVPSLSDNNLFKHCNFVGRCPEKSDICMKEHSPEMIEVENGHFVRCHMFSKKYW